MHLRRVIVALLIVPVLYLYVTQLPPAFFLVLLIAVSLLAQNEFYGMYKAMKSLSFLGMACGFFVLGAPFFFQQKPEPVHYQMDLYAAILVLSFMLIATFRLFLVKKPESCLNDVAPVITGFFYIPNLLLPQYYLRLAGHEWILLLYGCVWASDSAAYYTGTWIGKRKLYREVSPNKTVEGAVGSVIGGVLSAVLLGFLLLKGVSFAVLGLIGFLVGGVTIAGDLVESMFKRDAGVKDSGTLVPGHGGILDKIDGVLFAGPVLYLMTLWI